MDRARINEVGWSPVQGSYEEAVLSWHEQTEQALGRQLRESQQPVAEPRSGRETASQSRALTG